MKLGWFNAEDWERQELENRDIKPIFHPEPLGPDCEDLQYDAVTVFASSRLTAEVLENIQPKAVFTRSTGFDHIDLDKAEELGVKVYNVPEYGSYTVAEHAFALLLSLSRNILEGSNKTKESFENEGLTGFELRAKKIGIIGTGRIGCEMIKMCKSFGMDVIAYDPYEDRELEEELGFMYVSFEDLVRHSDIISLHCPLTDENHHLFSDDEFKKMDETVFINTARGELVNSQALLNALKQDHVSKAGLDVLENENSLEEIENLTDTEEFCCEETEANCELIERRDVTVTPHNGFNTEEAKKRILDTTIENIIDRPEENRII